jgi:penicillin-binding protein 1A
MDEAQTPAPADGAATANRAVARPWDRLRGARALVAAAAAWYLLTVAGLGVLWYRCGVSGCPDVARLRAYQPGKASRLLDRRGRPFGELRPVEGATVPLRRIPPHVRDAFLAVEDQRFYGHDAVDYRRVIGAALANVRGGGFGQGFSTVTMQLARNVFPERIPARERTLGRKLLEVRVAYEIEDRFEKDEILELYLSHIYFGNGARGIDAAARHYFGVPPDRLTLSQAALLAALPKSPTQYDPRRHPDRARERRDLVIGLMQAQERIGADEAQAAKKAALGVVRRRGPAGGDPGLAPYFVEEVRRQLEDRLGERLYEETLKITTTLDLDLQKAAEEELQRQLKSVEQGALGRFRGPRYDAATPPTDNGTPYLQGAVVALDVRTGDVTAWVGGRDFRHSRFDRVKSSFRQTGSAFKPFVYAAALAKGHVLTERLLDQPIVVELDRRRVWEPKNFDGEYDGEVTMREALVRSKNVPTVRLAQEVGLEDVAAAARRTGIHSEIDVTPAMPLGTVALSPLELATAYSAFAGLGEAAVPRLVLRVESERGAELFAAGDAERHTLLDAGVAFLVTSVLEDALARGTGTAVRAAGFAGPAAGKTGTTNDATDTWFVGYTPETVAAVWIGFDEPRPIMAAATGGRLAAPVWARTMRRAAAGRPVPARWRPPSNVEQAWVDPATGTPLADECREDYDGAYRELFLRGTMPEPGCPDHGRSIWARIFDWLPSDEDDPVHDPWPEDLSGRSEPPPPPEYEEAERWRRRQRREAQRRAEEWAERMEEMREEMEERRKEARKAEERRREQWEEEQKRRRKERQRRRRAREE